MKRKFSLLGLTAGAALLLASGCGKQEQPVAASGSDKGANAASEQPANPAAALQAAAGSAVSAATNAVDTAKATAQAAVTSAKTAVVTATTDASNAVSTVVATAQPTVATLEANATNKVSALLTSFTKSTSIPTNTAQLAQTGTNQVSTAANSQIQSLLDRAKGLVGEQKYQEALGVVQQLSSIKLTPEQQQLVDSLKTKIQSALTQQAAGQAGSVLGGLLGGKK